LSNLQYKTVNVFKGNIYRPIFLYLLLVRSTGEQDGSSRADLLSYLEEYKNGEYFCCVIPIKEKEQIYGTSHINKRGAINESTFVALDIKFRASKAHPEFKVAIM